MVHVIVFVCHIATAPSDCDAATAFDRVRLEDAPVTQCALAQEQVAQAAGLAPAGYYFKIQCGSGTR